MDVMKKVLFGLALLVIGFEFPAFASEYQEVAMCNAVVEGAAFPRISIQTEPQKQNRAILILTASDGWTQVYSGPVRSSSKALSFVEDAKTVSATFSKIDFKARISFNGDEYVCDSRSFGG
jgi:hypothetical protein